MESGIVKLLGFIFAGIGVILGIDSFGITGHIASSDSNSGTFLVISMIAIFVGILLMSVAYGKLRVKNFQK